jgi:hypothetical protein
MISGSQPLATVSSMPLQQPLLLIQWEGKLSRAYWSRKKRREKKRGASKKGNTYTAVKRKEKKQE